MVRSTVPFAIPALFAASLVWVCFAGSADEATSVRAAQSEHRSVIYLPIVSGAAGEAIPATPSATPTPTGPSPTPTDVPPTITPSPQPMLAVTPGPGTVFNYDSANDIGLHGVTVDEARGDVWTASGHHGKWGSVRWDLDTGTYAKFQSRRTDQTDFWDPQQLVSDGVYKVEFVDDGSIWFATERGASHLAPDGTWTWECGQKPRQLSFNWDGGSLDVEGLESTGGTWLGESGRITGELEWFGRGCNEDPHPDVTGRIALIDTGLLHKDGSSACKYYYRVMNAQNAGARAVVMIPNQDENTHQMLLSIGEPEVPSIPAVMVDYETGSRLRSELDDGNAVSAVLEPGLSGLWVHDIAVDDTGTVWFATDSGLCLLTRGADGKTEWQCKTTRNSEIVHDFIGSLALVSVGGQVEEAWIGTGYSWEAKPGGGVSVWSPRDDEWRSYTVADGMPVGSQGGGPNCIAVEMLPEGRTQAWTVFADDSSGMCRLAPTGEVQCYKEDGSGFSLEARCVAIDADGRRWFTSRTGVSVLAAHGQPGDGDDWTRYDAEDGISGATGIDFDSRGNAWVGTSQGLARISPNGDVERRLTDDKLYKNEVMAMEPSDDGSWWVATKGGGLGRLQGEDWHWYGGTRWDTWWVTGLAMEHGDDPASAADDALWYSARAYMTWGAVCRRLLDPSIPEAERVWCWTPVETPELPETRVEDIAVDADGWVWVPVPGHGVLRVKTTDPPSEESLVVEQFTQEDGLLHDYPSRVDIDQSGNKWFTHPYYVPTLAGVSVLSAEGSTWSTHTTESTDGRLPLWAYTVQCDRDTGDTYVGTYGGGAAVYGDDGTWRDPITVDDGLWPCPESWSVCDEDVVLGIAIDADGDRWFGGKYSVSRLSASGDWTHWGLADGLRIDTYGFVSDIDIDQDGAAWLNTRWGISRLMPLEPGDEAESFLDFPHGTVVHQDFESFEDTDVYRFRVDEPYRRVEVVVDDPEARLDVSIARAKVDQAAIARGRGGKAIPRTGNELIGLSTLERGDQRLVWDVASATGEYLIVVSPKDGTEGWRYPHPYSLRLGLSEVPASTLILTDRDRLDYLHGKSEVDGLADVVERFAAHESVGGVVYWSLHESSVVPEAVAGAYNRWLSPRGLEPHEAADMFTDAVRDWVLELRSDPEKLPGLRYVVLLGDDRVVPHLRVRIPPAPGEPEESEYLEELVNGEPPVSEDTRIGRALAGNFTLSDDIYGAAVKVPWGLDRSYLELPELAVGRLVESPRDMTAVLNAFLESDGTLELDSTLTAGYEMMEDGTDQGETYLRNAGVPHDSRNSLQGGSESGSPGWTAKELLDELLSRSLDLAFLAAHSDHYSHLSSFGHYTEADDLVFAEAIATSTEDVSGRLVYGLACHGGLNVPGDGHGVSMDLPEAWLGRGATYIGSTGYAYGYPGELQYQEDLMSEFTRLLVSGDGMAVGDALVRAKREYFWDLDSLDESHAKTLAGTVLYGLPMYRVQVARGPGVYPISQYKPEITAGSLERVSEDVASMTVQSEIDTRRQWLREESGGTYYMFPDRRPRSESGEPVQPKFSHGIAEQTFKAEGTGRVADQTVFRPRGLLWLGGKYIAESNFTPVVRMAQSLCPDKCPSIQQAPVFQSEGPFPTVPVVMRTLSDAEGAGTVLVGAEHGMLLYTAGQYVSDLETEWLFESMDVEVLYSASGDLVPPVIESVSTRPWSGDLQYAVNVSDTTGTGGEGVVQRVLATYTDGTGAWVSVDLEDAGGGTTWQGQLPSGAVVLIQAVDEAGNVAVDDNEGAFYTR